MTNQGHNGLMDCLVDFFPLKVHDCYEKLLSPLGDIGLHVSKTKVVPVLVLLCFFADIFVVRLNVQSLFPMKTSGN